MDRLLGALGTRHQQHKYWATGDIQVEISVVTFYTQANIH